jgi:hypothetical protein
MQMTGHNYYGTSRRVTRGGRSTRMHDLSGGYYYEHPQQYVFEIDTFFSLFLSVF